MARGTKVGDTGGGTGSTHVPPGCAGKWHFRGGGGGGGGEHRGRAILGTGTALRPPDPGHSRAAPRRGGRGEAVRGGAGGPGPAPHWRSPGASAEAVPGAAQSGGCCGRGPPPPAPVVPVPGGRGSRRIPPAEPRPGHGGSDQPSKRRGGGSGYPREFRLQIPPEIR